MNNLNVKKRAFWFINTETERVLMNLKNGAVNKENAIGSFNTLYQMASSLRDSDSMIHLCQIIEKVRNSEHRVGLFYFTDSRQETI